MHGGPLVAGVIGTHKFVYDVRGDTVNTASRMEEYGAAGEGHLPAATVTLAGNAFTFEPRGEVDVKGKGLMETYFLATLPKSASSPVRSPAEEHPAGATLRKLSAQSMAPFSEEMVCDASDAEIARFDRVVGPKLLRRGGIHNASLFEDMHVIDQLDRQRGVLLDKQDR